MIKTYRVKPGFKFGPGDVYKAGALVEIEESEAAPFLDKLDLVETIEVPAKTQGVPPELKNELGAKVPDDLKLIQPEKEEFDGTTGGFKIDPPGSLGEDVEETDAEDKPKRKSRSK